MRLPRWAVAAIAVPAGLLGVYALVALASMRDEESTAGGDESPPLDLVVLGDSFVEHSRDQIAAYAEAQGLDAEVMGLGGTAICNWDDKLSAYAADPPAVMVVSFAGNDIPGTCFNPTDESRDAATVAAAYREDLDAVVEMFADAGSELYAVVPPPIRDVQFEERAAAMRVMYAEAADDLPSLHLIDSATQLDPQGTGFQESLPCASWDTDCPATGEVVVRQTDGIHVTPAGAERYARAIVDAVD